MDPIDPEPDFGILVRLVFFEEGTAADGDDSLWGQARMARG